MALLPSLPVPPGVPTFLPLGFLVIALLVAYAIYAAVRRLRRGSEPGVPVRPMRPDPVPHAPPDLQAALDAAATAPGGEAPPDDALPTPPSSRRGRVALPYRAPTGPAMVSRRGYNMYTLPPAVEGEGVATQAPPAGAPPPAVSGFGWRMLIAYIALAIPLIGWSPYFTARLASWILGTPFPSTAPPAHPYFFAFYDNLVQAAGTLLYWPQSWPGPANFLVGPNVLGHALVDYIFTMYLVLLLSFVLASGLARPGRYTPSQRGAALAVILGYIAASVLCDVFFYAIAPKLAYSSIALVGRAFIGGTFFSFLLFVSLAGPPPMYVAAGFPRRTGYLSTFFATALFSIAAATFLLLAAYELLGIGRNPVALDLGAGLSSTLAPFALLLLMPLLALLIFAFVGRSMYARDVRDRPVPPLAKWHPPVSILIPAYNEEVGIAATIRSADRAARLYPGTVEILVGNDGSRDRTSEKAREAMAHLHHAHGRVLDLEHGGKSNALNAALRAARGEVVIRVDADTRISPDRGFSAMVPPFADPEVGGVQGFILPLQREGWTRKLRMLEILWNHLFLRPAYFGTRCAQVVDGAYCAFRRADILALGGWVPWNGEDTEITYRLQRVGFRFRFVIGAVAYEDVPAAYPALKKQRIRWTRGSYFAHHRHYSAILSDTPEFGGIALVLWLAIFIRGGMRHLVYVYAILLTFLLGLQTLWHIALVFALLLVPRGLVMAYYLLRLRAYSYLPWILSWPFTSALKQFIAMEGYGTILPGAIPEFSE